MEFMRFSLSMRQISQNIALKASSSTTIFGPMPIWIEIPWWTFSRRKSLSTQNLKEDWIFSSVKKISLISIFEGRISCVTLSYEVYEYKRLQENSVPSEIPLFRQLEREGKQLMKNVNLDVFPRGKYLYATWSVLHYDGELDKFSKGETLIKNQRFYINQGFQGVIFRSSNERMYKLVIPIGGKLMQTVPFIKDGNTYKLFFVDLPFNTELLDMAEQFIHNQRQILAKSISAKL